GQSFPSRARRRSAAWPAPISIWSSRAGTISSRSTATRGTLDPGSSRCSPPRAEPARGRSSGPEVFPRRTFGVSLGGVFARINVIALNTYREAVRARVLHGLFGLALATGAYCLVVASYATRDHERVVSDLGAASISIYGIIVAVVLGATSLYQEL